ncbi:traB domain-containing protein isoform X2 [Lycorma delicatula]|uniref:traB domain-containing protein isoform X2 n=1 Tax=Lycorma delicatula TaxID=130591 RepID=UPI003F512E5C
MGLDDEQISPTSSSDHGSPGKSVESKLHSESSDLEEEEKKNRSVPSDKEISIEQFDKNLPDTVQLLTTPDGAKVYLVGTAHFSLESQDDVSKVIQTVRPHLVMVELCPSRASILKMDEETIEREAKNISFEKMRDMIKEHGTFQGLLYILLLNMSARLTKDLGMAPGGEFRRAFAEAKKLGNCAIQFGDRPISITLKRALSVLSWWKSFKLIWLLLFSNQTMSKEEVEKCKQRDLLDSMLAEMAGKFPELNQVFVEERDVFLTHSLQLAAQTSPANLFNNEEPLSKNIDEPTRVVGIVGIGHASGITRHWLKVTDDMIPPLMLIPPRSRSSILIGKSFKIAGIGLLLWGCYKLTPAPKIVLNAFHSVPVPDFLLSYKYVSVIFIVFVCIFLF